MKDSDQLNKLEQQIREKINRSTLQNILLKDKTQWNQLCSSLDVLGDTLLALDSYREMPFPNDAGAAYIRTYGVLQALFLQQDAIRNLADSLGIVLEFPVELRTIREIRNDATGHPTKRAQGKKSYTHHFISRITMRKEGFQLRSTANNVKDHIFRDIKLLEIVGKQILLSIDLCKRIIDIMDKQEKQHKVKFRDVKLADIFPQTMTYYFTKVFEGTINNDAMSLDNARYHLDLIKEVYDKFIAELKRRDELRENDWLTYHIEEILYPIKKLIEFCRNDGTSNLVLKDAEVFAGYLMTKHEEMLKAALEIDKKYSK